MPSLKGRSPSSAYQELLKISNTGAGLDGTLRNIEDGAGNPTGIQIGTNMVAIFGYKFPASGFAAGQMLRINSANNAFEWHIPTASDISGLATVASTGHYSDLSGLPAIPTSLSQLTNDAGFMTQQAIQSTYGSGQYQLPIATATALGGIKVGTGLTIDALTGVMTANVTSVAGRTGAVTLSTTDISGISNYAPLASPVLTGTPLAPTASLGTNSTQIATTAFVANAVTSAVPTKVSQLTNDSGFITASNAPVTSVAGRTGAITLAVSDVSGAAPLASPVLTGVPKAPTAVAGTNTTQIATTAFVQSAVPTKTSQLTNDSNFVSSGALATVATTGSYTDLANIPIYNFDGGDVNTNPLFYQLVVIDGGTQ